MDASVHFAPYWRSMQAVGLVGWWPLLGGSPAPDLAYRNDGTLVSSPSYIDQELGPAIRISATGCVQPADQVQLQSADWTVSAWIRLMGSPATNHGIIAHGTSGSPGHYYFFAGGSPIKLYVDIPWVAGQVVIGSSTLSSDVWYFVAATRSGTTYSVYLNGLLDGSNTHGATPTVTGNFGIGALVGDQIINGAIVDARVKNYGASAAEIWHLYDPATRWELYGSSRGMIKGAAAAVSDLPIPRNRRLSNQLLSHWRAA